MTKNRIFKKSLIKTGLIIKKKNYCVKLHKNFIYFLKVSIGNSEYLHLKVYMPLPMYNSELILTDIVTDRDEQDPFFFV